MNKKKTTIIISAIVVVIILVIVCLLVFGGKEDKTVENTTSTEQQQEFTTEDKEKKPTEEKETSTEQETSTNQKETETTVEQLETETTIEESTKVDPLTLPAVGSYTDAIANYELCTYTRTYENGAIRYVFKDPVYGDVYEIFKMYFFIACFICNNGHFWYNGDNRHHGYCVDGTVYMPFVGGL